MGEGGFITLVNGTNYNWQLTHSHSYQMNAWSWPATINAGQSIRIYVEWDQGIFHSQSDDAGEARYSLVGTSSAFEVQSRGGGGFKLQIYFVNLTTQNNAQGSTLNLGWKHDGQVNFILSGTQGNFFSSNPVVNWMHNNLAKLGNRPLRHICIPGSHDAGMSTLIGGTAFVNRSNTVTQYLSIGDQLNAGSRYFDFRPVISGGTFKAGHYSHIDALNSWQGGNGQSFQDMINQINAFTSTHQELVILNLSHDFNTDVGNNSYRAFNQGEWNSLMQQMLGIQHLFVAPNSTTVDLTTLTLNQFIGNGHAAVIVIIETGGVSLGDYANKGFYSTNQLRPYNSYSDSNDTGHMANDQLQKLKTNRPTPDSGYFLLSWTLTQDATQAALTGPSILQLASQANPAIYNQLLGSCTKQTYPNILYIDGLTNGGDITALAMAVNDHFAS